MFRIDATPRYLRDIEGIGPEAHALLLKKIERIRQNPYREKRLTHPRAVVFRVRFSDRGADKRLIYSVERNTISLLAITDRKHGYDDLNRILRGGA